MKYCLLVNRFLCRNIYNPPPPLPPLPSTRTHIYRDKRGPTHITVATTEYTQLCRRGIYWKWAVCESSRREAISKALLSEFF